MERYYISNDRTALRQELKDAGVIALVDRGGRHDEYVSFFTNPDKAKRVCNDLNHYERIMDLFRKE